MKKYSIKDMQEWARKKDGFCLSKEYINAHSELIWKCENGHIWKAPFHSIRKGSWCPRCKGKNRTIEDMRKIAESKGGKYLSTKYYGSQTKVQWECSMGHRWFTAPVEIFRNRWCPECGRISCGEKLRDNIEQMNELAESKGWKCLSKEYVDTQTKLKWQCKNGHVWEAVPANIRRGYGCPKCWGKNPTTKDFQKIAKARGGKLLSKVYSGSQSHLLWECELGHQWQATPNMIKKGTWCNVCSAFLSERITRGYFEKIFQTPFPKKHPKWLINSNGNRMELDGFSEKLNIAFEYQGIQHYKRNVYSITDEKLSKRKEDDKTKVSLCKEYGVKLFIINYLTLYEDIPKVIKEQCLEHGIKTNKINLDVNLDINDFYSPFIIKQAMSLAKKRGGECLSKKAIRRRDGLMWKCVKGHVWKAPLWRIRTGHWCRFCAGNVKFTYDYVKKEIESAGEYSLLSKEYIKANSKLVVLHKKCGNKLDIKFSGWRTGYRCRFCAPKERAEKRKLSYNFVKGKIEREKDYKLISKEYIDANSKLHVFHESCGTEYQVTYAKWYLGRRCPNCRRRKKN